ncbi:MAG: hypothetical protein ACRYFX_01020 [Janthinobacterium lividum]
MPGAARAAGFKIGSGFISVMLAYILDQRRHFEAAVGDDDADKGQPHAYSLVARKLLGI